MELNNMIELLKTRVSSPKLTSPAPNAAELEQVLACGLRAPDHGRLKPWHFHIVQGGAREELGTIFAQFAATKSEASQDKLEKCKNMPMRAPLLLVAVCEPVVNPKIPVMEQMLAVGAAMQNMQIAISSLGFSSIWRTGEMATAKPVLDAFNVSENGSIVGFLYVGTAIKALKAPAINVSDHTSHWGGEC